MFSTAGLTVNPAQSIQQVSKMVVVGESGHKAEKGAGDREIITVIRLEGLRSLGGYRGVKYQKDNQY
jgi:hypothetical protein